jgi:hypothetical protein
MEGDLTPSPEQERSPRSLDDLRRWSRHRQWESSARIAVRRGQGEQPASLEEPASSGRHT